MNCIVLFLLFGILIEHIIVWFNKQTAVNFLLGFWGQNVGPDPTEKSTTVETGKCVLHKSKNYTVRIRIGRGRRWSFCFLLPSFGSDPTLL